MKTDTIDSQMAQRGLQMELRGSRWSGSLFWEVLEEAGGCILLG